MTDFFQHLTHQGDFLRPLFRLIFHTMKVPQKIPFLQRLLYESFIFQNTEYEFSLVLGVENPEWQVDELGFVYVQ